MKRQGRRAEIAISSSFIELILRMNLFSIFNKKKPEPASVAEALSGVADTSAARSRGRRAEQRNTDAQNEQLVPEKKRARRRLIGAIAMVLAIVIGLPMVLDSEPKPINRNIVIQIPSKDVPASFPDSKEEVIQNEVPEQPARQTVAPTAITAPALGSAPVALPDASGAGPAASKPASKDVVNSAPDAGSAPGTSTPSARVAVKPDAKTEPRHDAAPAATKDSTTKPKPAAKTTDSHTGSDDAARAQAILDGSDTTTGSGSPAAIRIVIQVGAFATQEKVAELQDKLASAGIKSFTQKVATSSGDKIRVRVGPFPDKESADKMKRQLEKLGLNASLITL